MAMQLSMAVRQNATISPRMQQAIRLLQLSMTDFELALRDARMSNPFLEEDEAPGNGDLPANDGAPEQNPVQADVAAPIQTEESPPVDNFAFERMPAAQPDTEGPQLGWVPEARSLRDHLRTQLYASQQPENIVRAAEIVIETLDDDGYLRDRVHQGLVEQAEGRPLSGGDFDQAIALLRQFDPVGVCARSLVDCLALQLSALPPETTGLALAREILGEHVDLLGRRDYCGLRQRLQCDDDQLREAVALIRRLDPDPGSRYSSKAPDYIVPDVIVTRRDGRFVVACNPALRVGARLNQRYVDLFRGCRRSQHPAMAQQLQEARWLVRNAEQRFDTILRVATAIVERQQAYFNAGDIALKPMVLREVADELGMHESTVSRATNNKYMATPHGCIEFKHFFSRELPMQQGRSCSAASARSLIQRLIDDEHRDAPLSDVDLATALQSRGIHIARRTVTKYRRLLKVPSAEFRRAG